MKILMKVYSTSARKRAIVEKPYIAKFHYSDQHPVNVNKVSCCQQKTPNWIIAIIAVMFLIAVAIVYYFNFGSIRNTSSVEQNIHQSKPASSYSNTIDREFWGASQTAGELHLMSHPVSYVVITHIGDQMEPCSNKYECALKLRKLQNISIVQNNLLDIPANFYISNDGWVFKGRGWKYNNSYAKQTLAVCFLGDYTLFKPEAKQLIALKNLIDIGVTGKFIDVNYKLIAQNQTQNTRSPGIHVYNELIKWKNWYRCGNVNEPKCGFELKLPDIWRIGD